MTTAQKKKVGEMVASAIIGLISTLFILFGTGAWQQKESVADHKSDVSAIVELQIRTLDLLCDDAAKNQTKTTKRVCDAPRPNVKP